MRKIPNEMLALFEEEEIDNLQHTHRGNVIDEE
jgi:hypothetical protein